MGKALKALTKMVLAFGEGVQAEDTAKAAALAEAYLVIEHNLQKALKETEKERCEELRDFCSKNVDKRCKVTLRRSEPYRGHDHPGPYYSVMWGVLRSYWPGNYSIVSSEACPISGHHVRSLYFPDIVSIECDA